MIKLRKYQEEALQYLFDYWGSGKGVAPIICAPTGSGKSLMIAEFCKRVCKETPHVRIMILAHVRELLTQNEKELKNVWAEAVTGIYSAGLGKKQIDKQITFAGIQSVYSKVFSFPKIDIVIIDECHLVPRNATTRYRRFLSDIVVANPKVCIVGFSATPFRLDSGMLTDGEDAIFDGIAYSVDIKQLIADGYLVPIISKGGAAQIDLTDVHIRAGEYQASELAHAADSPELVRIAVAEIVKYGKDRKAWLIFCSGVTHAEHVTIEVKKHGVECKVVTGDTQKEERDAIIADFKNGKLRAIANVGVMTTGVNVPICDLVALMTATTSAGRYVQMCGRTMRTHPNKENALLLDYGGNCLRFGMLDDINPIRERNIFNVVKNPDPVKECPNCHVILHTRTMICPACDFAFPVTAQHGTEAYAGAVLSDQQQSFIVEVKEMYCTRHKKLGGVDSLKCAFYDAADKEYAIWLCLNHTGFAKDKAVSIVRQFGGKADSVDSALKEWSYWRSPTHIRVRPEGKFYRIDGFKFDESKIVTRQACLFTGEVT